MRTEFNIYPPRYGLGSYPLAWTGQQFVHRPTVKDYQGKHTSPFYPACLPMNPTAYGYTEAGVQVAYNNYNYLQNQKEERYKMLTDYILGDPTLATLWEPTCGYKYRGGVPSLTGNVLMVKSRNLLKGGPLCPGLKFKNPGEATYFLTHCAGFTAPNIGKGYLNHGETGDTLDNRGGTFYRKLPARLQITKSSNQFTSETLVSKTNGVTALSLMDPASCIPWVDRYYAQISDYFTDLVDPTTALPLLAWTQYNPEDSGAIWFQVAPNAEGPTSENRQIAPSPFIVYPIPLVDSDTRETYLITLWNAEVMRGAMEPSPQGPVWKLSGGWGSIGFYYKVYPTFYPRQKPSDYPREKEQTLVAYKVNGENLKTEGYQVSTMTKTLGTLEFDIIMCTKDGTESNGVAKDIIRKFWDQAEFLERIAI